MKKTGKIRNVIIILLMLLAVSCTTDIRQLDNFQKSFNDHVEGWLNLLSLIGLLGGGYLLRWIGDFLKNHLEALKQKETKKSPLLGSLSINGYSVYHQFNWDQAIKSAEKIASEISNGRNCYEPTMLVCIGRGGAIYGGMLSYHLSEVPILALDRTYIYDEQGNRKEKPMYPFRIPKAYLKRVLLVAGESHTRKTMLAFAEQLRGLGAEEIRNCAFYNQIFNVKPGFFKRLFGKKETPHVDVAPVTIHYYGYRGVKDYLMPWQNRHSLHPSENKEDANVQNRRIKQYVSESNNMFIEDMEGFYCMRHAETEANSQDVFIGSGTDIPLSEVGKNQAHKVGQYFKEIGISFDVIYHSPMIRCMQTASEISAITGGQLIGDERLKEIDFGFWEGLPRAEIENKYTDDYKLYCTDMSSRPTGGSESLEDVAQRIRAFLHDIMVSKATMGKKVLVVTHKTAGRIMLQQAGHNAAGYFRDVQMGNASISYISINGDKLSVIMDDKRCGE